MTLFDIVLYAPLNYSLLGLVHKPVRQSGPESMNRVVSCQLLPKSLPLHCIETLHVALCADKCLSSLRVQQSSSGTSCSYT